MPTNIPIMPILIVILLLLPVKMTGHKLKTLAFTLWVIGGLFLLIRGVLLLSLASLSTTLAMVALVVTLAAIIGLAKGKFVLSKTSQKNIARLDALTEPKRPIQVYSVRSWIIIGLMVGISIALTIFSVPNLIRGGVNIAIGLALLVSSLGYLKSLTAAKTNLS